ncbi:AraC family transcriptional regulator [Taklimakanibacter lacteus]|uniref:AraC family transcriptional regulator n=1 Tax=Taklimakanibacter lacteus TaxID=2268456 RepID=UPI0013C4AEF4
MPKNSNRPTSSGRLGFGISGELHFDDPDAFAAAFPGGNYGVIPLDHEPFHSAIKMANLGGGVSVRSASFAGGVLIRAEFVGDLPTIAFLFPCINGGHAVFNGREADPRSLTVSHGNISSQFRLQGPHELAAITIQRDTMLEAYDALSGGRAPACLSSSTLMTVNPTHAERIGILCGEANDMLKLLPGTKPQMNPIPGLNLLRDRMLATLITTIATDRDERDRRAMSRQTAAMARIERHIDDHAHEISGLQDLCAGVGMALRTIEAIIRSRTGLTALDYLKRRRLAFVHRQLLNPVGATTVANAALSFGFLHFGRFSAEYRRAYGELPSHTLARTLGKSID